MSPPSHPAPAPRSAGPVAAVLALVACYARPEPGPSLVRLEPDAVGTLEASFSPSPPERLFVDLSRKGLAGGQLTFVLPGAPADVHAMLLDFDGATGKRPWARRYRVLEREGDRVLARWDFRGKLGIDPTVRLEFRTEREGDSLRIDYRVVEGALGLRTFDGAILLEPLGDGERTLVTESVFIDSGLPFVNASLQDIEAGLRADAEDLLAWMLEREAR